MWEPLFWLSAVLLGYTFIGYPVIVGILARVARREVAKTDSCPAVTIIISAYNSEEFIRRKIENCLSQDYPRDKLAVVVASDGSTDGTNDIVREFEDQGVVLLAFEERRGKAACLNDAVAACQTELVVLADARQRYGNLAVRRLMENLSDESVGAVAGVLTIEDEDHTGFSQGVDFYWRYETFIRRSEAAFASVVGVSGAIYALRRSLFRPIPVGTILDDVLIPMNVVLGGQRVVFEPKAEAFDVPSRDPKWERRRKIRTLAGNYQLVELEPQLLNPSRNSIWVQFVSHKLLRLVAPLFLLFALISSVVLESEGAPYSWLFVAQLIFYVLALLGVIAPAMRAAKTVRVPMTFLLLNWFAVLGLFEYLTRKETHKW